MSRVFKLTKDPYDNDYDLYKKEAISLNPGVTVLVGCNGIGKTSLLHSLERQLKKEEIKCIKFDNLKDGGTQARSKAAFYGRIDILASSMCSSEGENIIINMNQFAAETGSFVRKYSKEKELWILLDGIDSGLSIDNVVDIKKYLFQTILESNQDKDVYIIVSANGYEMARDLPCFDVYEGKYLSFASYEEYREFILASKKQKEDRERVDNKR